MNLTKNQIYIISAIVILVVAWFLFFRKKPGSVAAKMATPPPPPPPAGGGTAPGESGWTGAWNYTPAETVKMLSGSYDPYENGYLGLSSYPRPTAQSLGGSDWLANNGKVGTPFVNGGAGA